MFTRPNSHGEVSSPQQGHLTVVGTADLEPAHGRQHRQVGEAGQTEEDAAEGVSQTRHLVVQPPEGERERNERGMEGGREGGRGGERNKDRETS